LAIEIGAAPRYFVQLSTNTAASGNQWYPYPNYFLEQVVAETNLSPPFPASADAGQCAAYNYISNGILCGGEDFLLENEDGSKGNYTAEPRLLRCVRPVAVRRLITISK
jgi:hypothetical protein